MRKILCVVLAILLVAVTVITAYANDDTLSFQFALSSNGKNMVEVNKGDVITVTFHLYRTDASDPYTMYAMQNEICYDNAFFELVEGSAVVKNGIVSTDIGLVDQHREFYMNFLSMSGGAQWDADSMVGSIQLRVIADSGVTTIENQNYLVSTRDGTGAYMSEASDLTVVLTTNCTVTFDSNGGSLVPDQVVQFGEKITEPDAPVREGYDFAGWYQDIHLTEAWDFENDTVEGNMRLYAKWTEDILPEEPIQEKPAQKDAPVNWHWWLILLVLPVAAYVAYRKARKNQK